MRVLVVGAGVAGLASAIALRRAGLTDVTIIERGTDVAAQRGTGVAIPPNGARALSQLGLSVPDLVAQGSRLREYRFLTAGGRSVTTADLTRLWLSDQLPYFAVRRDRLHAMLLGTLGSVRIEFETTTELVVADLDPDVPVQAVIRGPGGRSRVEEFDLIVAADGIHSAARSQLWPHVAVHDLGWRAWRCVLDLDNVVAETQVVYSGRHGVFLLMPLGDRQSYVYAAVRSSDDAPSGDHGCALTRQFGGFAVPRPIVEAVTSLPDEAFYTGPLEEVRHEELAGCSRGAITLVGDAWHGCSPNMAQGVSLAVEDAVVLGELVKLGGPIPDRLWQRRLPRIGHVQTWTRKRDHLINRRSGSGLFLAASDLVMRLKGGDSLQRDAFGYLLENAP